MKALHLLFSAAFLATSTLGHAADVTSTSITGATDSLVKLDALVHLTSDQKAKASAIFDHESTALDDARTKNPGFPGAGGSIFKTVEQSIAEIRALLTPDQLAVYDRTPQTRGGGVTLATPEEQLRMLDRELGLSAAQKPIALQVFKEEYDAVLSLPWDQRRTEGAKYHKVADAEIHALLTPQQIENQNGAHSAQATRANEEVDAAEAAVRTSSRLVTKIGDIVSVEKGPRRSRMAQGTRTGLAQFQVTGARSAETVVVSWERNPATAPVKITKIAGANGEVFGP